MSTLDELRAQRDTMGNEIRMRHMALDKAAARGNMDPDEEESIAELERQWKVLNAQVRDLET